MKEKETNKQMLSIPEENVRFMKVLSYYKYSGYKLSKEVEGISEAKITHIRNGRNKPSLELINVLIKKFPEVNKSWLLNGEGNMLNSPIEGYSTSQDELKFDNLSMEEKLSRIYTAHSDSVRAFDGLSKIQERNIEILTEKIDNQNNLILEQSNEIKELKSMLSTLLKSKH